MKRVYLAAALMALAGCGKDPATVETPKPVSTIVPAPIQEAPTTQPEVSEPPTQDAPAEPETPAYPPTECAGSDNHALTRSEIISQTLECKKAGLNGYGLKDQYGQLYCIQCDPGTID